MISGPPSSMDGVSHLHDLRQGFRGNHTHRKLANLITVGPQPCLTQRNQAMPAGQPKTGGATQDGRVMVERSDRAGGPLEKGMASHFSILALRTP